LAQEVGSRCSELLSRVLAIGSMGATVAACSMQFTDFWDMGIQPSPPALVLRVLDASTRQCPFSAGDVITVTKLEKVDGWDPLSWRYLRASQQATVPVRRLLPEVPLAAASAASTSASAAIHRLSWPQGYRFSSRRWFWRAMVAYTDFSGTVAEQPCMLQVAEDPVERTSEHVQAELEDARLVASRAHGFGDYLNEKVLADGGEKVPSIKVSAPAACLVANSAVSEFVGVDDCVSVAPYAAPEVTKFAFDGTEEFLELPQAFFHYVAWASGGSEVLCDLQGAVEEDGSLLAVDPCLWRRSNNLVANVLGAIVPDAQSGDKAIDGGQLFGQVHPRCPQLCKVFDPDRGTGGRLATRGRCGLRACGL